MNRSVKKQNAPSAPAWEQVILSAPDSPTLQLEFRFSPVYLQTLFGQDKGGAPPTPTTRSAFIQPDSETLMLSDTFTANGSSVFVNAWLVPAKAGDAFHLRVTIGPYLSTRRGKLTLYWDNEDFTRELLPELMFAEEITLPYISSQNNNLPTRRFRLFFELDPSELN